MICDCGATYTGAAGLRYHMDPDKGFFGLSYHEQTQLSQIAHIVWKNS